MKRALLPALIASIFAANGAMAADRELLFGPTGVVDSTPAAPKSQPKPAPKPRVVAKPAPAVVVPKPVIVAAPAPAPKPQPVVKAAPAPAPVVVAAPAPKPVAIPVAKAPSAPAPAPTSAPAPVAAAPAKLPGSAAAASSSASTPVTPVMPKLPEIAAAAPAAPVASARVEIMPPLPALDRNRVQVSSGADPMAVRLQLMDSLKNEVSVGFVPFEAGTTDGYAFVRHYMPLANHMSQQSGVLVNLVPQRNLQRLRKDIGNQRYAVLFINASTVRDAVKSGYVPLAQTQAMATPAYVVKADSKIQKIEDIKRSKVAWSTQDQLAHLAMADFAQRGLVAGNSFEEIGSDDSLSALNALVNSDVVVMSRAAAEQAVTTDKAKYRIVGEGKSAPMNMLWVRKDLAETELASRIVRSLLDVDSAASGGAKTAADALKSGAGVRFMPAAAGLADPIVAMMDVAEKSFQQEFPLVSLDAKQLASNRAAPSIQAISRAVIKDPSVLRARLQQTLRQQITVGFSPFASSGSEGYAFINYYLPLANQLSQSSGVLVNFVPEPSIDVYRKRLAEVRYPAVFLSPVLAADALKAGYVAVAYGRESAGVGYLVKKDSKIQKLEDAKGAKIGWSTQDQMAYLAMADFTKASAAKGNQFQDLGSADVPTALNAVRSGQVDLVAMSATAAQAASTSSKGELRFIASTVVAPVTALWVRSDLVGTDFSKRLVDGLMQVTAAASPSAVTAADAFEAGFGVAAKFDPASVDANQKAASLLEPASKSFPDLFKEQQIDQKVRTANTTSAPIQTRESLARR